MRQKLFFPLIISTAIWAQPSTNTYRVDSIEIVNHDLSQGSKTRTAAERLTLRWLDVLHIETQPWVIRKMLPVQVGDSIRNSEILEYERFLRGAIFLADDTISIRTDSSGKNVLRVATQDKWTTNLSANFQKPGATLDWWAGFMEFNFLGTGTQAGVLYKDIKNRQGWTTLLGNGALLGPRISALLEWTAYNDGFSWVGRINQRLSKWTDPSYFDLGFSFSEAPWKMYSWTGHKTQWESVKNPTLEAQTYKSLLTGYWDQTRVDSVGALLGLGHATDGSWRKELFARSDWYRRELGNPFKSTSLIQQSDTLQPVGTWNVLNRNDLWLGGGFKIQKQDLVKTVNYKKMRWQEDVDLGWQLSSGLYWDVLRADQTKGLRWTQAWSGALLKHKNVLSSTNLKQDLRFDEGKIREIQWRQGMDMRVLLSSSWSWNLKQVFHGFWGGVPGEFLTLGGYDGLIGAAEVEYAGRAVGYAQSELRWIPGPNWEFATLAPALALFGNASQGSESVQDFGRSLDWNQLDYRFGLGLRFGLTKSSQGIVNHINFSWKVPSADSKEEISGVPSITFMASTGL